MQQIQPQLCCGACSFTNLSSLYSAVNCLGQSSASLPRAIFAGSCTIRADTDILAPQSSHKSLHWIITFNSVQAEPNSPRSCCWQEHPAAEHASDYSSAQPNIPHGFYRCSFFFFYPITMNIMSRCSLHLPLFPANNPNKTPLAHAFNLSTSQPRSLHLIWDNLRFQELLA